MKVSNAIISERRLVRDLNFSVVNASSDIVYFWNVLKVRKVLFQHKIEHLNKGI